MHRLTSWPKPERGPSACLEVIREAAREGLIGHDSEFNTETKQASIFGVASRERCAAALWDNKLAEALLDTGVQISAYSGLGADRLVLEQMLHTRTQLSQWSDPMMRWYILNADLASVPKSAFKDEESNENMSLGFMGLWACTSMVHDLPNWKRCIGPRCVELGLPCGGYHSPNHNELDYCAVDAWAGLADDLALRERMSPQQQAYYEWRMRLSENCVARQLKGVPVDVTYIKRLEETFEGKKLALFPYTLVTSKEVTRKQHCECSPPTSSAITKERKDRRKACLKCNGTGKVSITFEKPLAKPMKQWAGPFNPNSPKAVHAWFLEHNIDLHDRTGKPSIGKPVVFAKLNRLLKPYDLELDPKSNLLVGGEEDLPPLSEALDTLLRLAQKQAAGKGLKSWFDSQYITNGEVHPRFNPCGTSMSRLSSSKPNFQNVPRVGFGAEVRKACVAKLGCKVLKADLSQLEFRAFLWYAGLDPNLADGAFESIVEGSEGKLKSAAARLSWTERDVAKSAAHANSYLEGISLRSASDLSTPLAQGDRAEGALKVYDGRDLPEWKFRGRYVCFTGGNLAERLFGDRKRSSRRAALEIQWLIINKFPQLREVHRKLAEGIESKPALVTLSHGHSLRFYNRSDEDDLKQAAAFLGQGSGALYAQEGILRFAERGDVDNLQVHDELVWFDIPLEWSNAQCLDFMRPMVQPSAFMAGFHCPAKVEVGPNWGEMQKIGVIRWQ